MQTPSHQRPFPTHHPTANYGFSDTRAAPLPGAAFSSDIGNHHPAPPSPGGSAQRLPTPSSARSITETHLANNVTSISRQLLASFAFSQVDNLVGDLAHMRQYLVSKLPDPQLLAESLDSESNGSPSHPHDRASRTITGEYKGALYGRRCLATQRLILEYLLGRCLQQCQMCLDELALSQVASRQVEESAQVLAALGEERGVAIDAGRLDSESANLYKQVRRDFYELGEELRFLDGAREVTEEYFRDPSSVLRPVR